MATLCLEEPSQGYLGGMWQPTRLSAAANQVEGGHHLGGVWQPTRWRVAPTLVEWGSQLGRWRWPPDRIWFIVFLRLRREISLIDFLRCFIYLLLYQSHYQKAFGLGVCSSPHASWVALLGSAVHQETARCCRNLVYHRVGISVRAVVSSRHVRALSVRVVRVSLTFEH